MNCKQVKIIIQQSLDGSITELQKRQVEEHCQQCAHCQEYYVSLHRLDQLLEQLPPVKPSYSLVDRVMERIEGEELGATLEWGEHISQVKSNRTSWKNMFYYHRSKVLAFGVSAALLFLFLANPLFHGVVEEKSVADQRNAPSVAQWIATSDWKSLLRHSEKSEYNPNLLQYHVEYEQRPEFNADEMKMLNDEPIILWSRMSENETYEMQLILDGDFQYVQLVRNDNIFFYSHPLPKEACVIIAETSKRTLRYEVSQMDPITNHQMSEDWKIDVVTLEEVRIH
ncbi:zf-HC2 domain-containing protein [Rubeoparvulum massiliense]|uniref:zf-HC2 domain-containing protein n=1 Tax=Rubeoparvulum massiliense TaxID=1631346 RepID=UPI00065DC207|nr:zf-HC2 domain-containing protein [Rubeoparvulum massiliense]